MDSDKGDVRRVASFARNGQIFQHNRRVASLLYESTLHDADHKQRLLHHYDVFGTSNHGFIQWLRRCGEFISLLRNVRKGLLRG